jgi:hypothetical protein
MSAWDRLLSRALSTGFMIKAELKTPARTFDAIAVNMGRYSYQILVVMDNEEYLIHDIFRGLRETVREAAAAEYIDRLALLPKVTSSIYYEEGDVSYLVCEQYVIRQEKHKGTYTGKIATLNEPIEVRGKKIPFSADALLAALHATHNV